MHTIKYTHAHTHNINIIMQNGAMGYNVKTLSDMSQKPNDNHKKFFMSNMWENRECKHDRSCGVFRVSTFSSKTKVLSFKQFFLLKEIATLLCLRSHDTHMM